MNCETFDSSLLDSLYDEVDSATSAAMAEHASGCSDCASRRRGFEKTLELVRPGLSVEPPEGLEAKILAAIDVASPVAGGAKVIRLDDHRPAARGVAAAAPQGDGEAKVVSFLSRPQLAVAASFLLVVVAAAVFLTSKRSEAPMAAMPAQASAPAEAKDQGGLAANAPPPMPVPPAATVAASAVGATVTIDGEHAADLQKAKALFNQHRYADALPKFEALSAVSPEAELYAARCLSHTKGCAAAIPRFESAAGRGAGTETSSRASLEAARCYKSTGQAIAARSKLEDLKTDNYVSREANDELAALAGDTTTTTKAGAGAAPVRGAAAPMPAYKPAKPAATASAAPAINVLE